MDDIPANLPRDRARGGAAHVFEALREEIIALRLVPGTVLSRAELQARFGLSSTPVRDALMRLEEEGLVDVFPQHATVVSPIDIGLAREAQFLRRSVEIELVRGLALKPDAIAIERMRSLIRQQGVFAEMGELEAFTNADQAFHRTLYEAAGIVGVWHLIRRRGAHIDRLRRLNLPVPGKMREILGAHGAIIDAIVAGDVAGAQDAMREHLSRSLDFVEKLRESHPEYFRK